MISLPTSTESDYTRSVVLEDETFDIRLQFNTREETWYCFLGPTGVEPIIKFKVTVGHDLLTPFKARDGVPKGSLWLVDSVAFFGRVDRTGLDQEGRWILVYLTEEEETTSVSI